MLFSGVAERIPYSLSRFTDLPATKWGWFEACLDSGQMVAFDPRTAAPGVWSLQPEDTLGLVFWTKDPANLVAHQRRLAPYRVTVHVTATGWYEIERGAPRLDEAGRLLVAASQAFDRLYWRFSPVPLLPDLEVLGRFQRLLGYAEKAGIRQAFVSFLQPNDQVPETRSKSQRFELLNRMAETAQGSGVTVVLCKDDQSFQDWQDAKFTTEACVQAGDFGGQDRVHLEDCGCVLMVDPFTINETCKFKCSYCYAADKSLSPKKRNTTRRLTVMR